MGRTQVLIVESDATARDRLGDWLEDAGYRVIACPGPSAPDYTCIGYRTQWCPLAEAADIIVLDMVLSSDAALEGVPAEELLAFYSWESKKVLALRHEGDPEPYTRDGSVIVAEWPPERNSFLEAVEELARADCG
jgi:hypothetical protein